ncbi:MAG: MerR family transcriptional regulator [Acidobacteria bacterium]|nr:MerR family transcriptional regulator [Acidobacteriota bacterium]
MLRIGDFARLSQMSVKALRFYDEIGLLKPTFIDRTTGYRYYAPYLLARLNRILAFKELGFSLAEIASLMQTDLSDEQMRRELERKRVELSQRIALEQSQLARLDALLQPLAGEVTKQQITLKKIPAALVASIRAEIDSYDQADELFIELQHYLRRHKCGGQRAAIWHACAGRNDHIDCEALILLNGRAPESKSVRVYELPSGNVASVVHEGGEETIERSYIAVRRWIKANGYDLAGPNREVYWSEAHVQTSVCGLTEIQFPISIMPKTAAAGA